MCKRVDKVCWATHTKHSATPVSSPTHVGGQARSLQIYLEDFHPENIKIKFQSFDPASPASSQSRSGFSLLGLYPCSLDFQN